jgi:hypothetical protein
MKTKNVKPDENCDFCREKVCVQDKNLGHISKNPVLIRAIGCERRVNGGEL